MRRALSSMASLGVAGALVLGACGSDPDAPFAGTPLDPVYTVPDVDLVDTEGDDFSLATDTDKRLTLVFFGYTRCEDICPAVLSNLASALVRLDESQRDDVDVVMVTSDPDYDTPERIRDYLDGFDTTFIGATSDFVTVVEVGRSPAVGIDRGGRATARGGRRGGGRWAARGRHRPRLPGRPHDPDHGCRRGRRGSGLLEPGHHARPVRRRHPIPARGLLT